MAKVYTIRAAKTHLSRLIAKVGQGEEVIIARGSRPVARLVAVANSTPKRQFGAMRGRAKVTAAFFEPLPDHELQAWED